MIGGSTNIGEIDEPLPLDSRQLWGNEAADDEDPSILDSYFVSQRSFAPFLDPQTRLSIARARKGVGKSALLRYLAYNISEQSDSLLITCTGADLVVQRPIQSLTPQEHIYDWEQRICMLINRELGSQIGLALDDDQLTLVETAELAGFKKRNLVGALLDRLSGKLGHVQLSKLSAQDHKALLGRVSRDSMKPVWVLIDDIDATFRRTEAESIRLSTFFSACRDLSRSFTGINVRTCVRSDVWASIRKMDEALDKCEQYIFDIQWTQKQTREILTERVQSFLQRSDKASYAKPAPNKKSGDKDTSVLNLVFHKNFNVGIDYLPPPTAIHIYSAGRPRWASQLCRMAGQEAIKRRHRAIRNSDVKHVLDAYGRFRLDDIAREHSHQCPQIIHLIRAFANGTTRYSTPELLDLIRKRILDKLTVQLDDVPSPSELAIANFLFRIGFLFAAPKDMRPWNVRFEEYPDLLTSAVNLDDDHMWEVHPSYHATLSLRLVKRIEGAQSA